jgi:TATA-binding protein-associated factor
VIPEAKPVLPSKVHSPTATTGPIIEKVVIDPSKGGAVSPKTAAQQSKALEVSPGYWVWDGLVKILEVDLFSAAWEVRHGAAMALRELLKVQGRYGGTKGKFVVPLVIGALIGVDGYAVGATRDENDISHERWCNHLTAQLLCVFILDRFGDFVSDQVRGAFLCTCNAF